MAGDTVTSGVEIDSPGSPFNPAIPLGPALPVNYKLCQEINDLPYQIAESEKYETFCASKPASNLAPKRVTGVRPDNLLVVCRFSPGKFITVLFGKKNMLFLVKFNPEFLI